MPARLDLHFDARRNERGIDPPVGEQRVGLVAVIRGGGQDEHAERLLHADHPHARFRQSGEACAGNRPGNRHSETEDKRQRQSYRRAGCVEIAREQHNLNHDRSDAGPRQKCGDRSHRKRHHEGAGVRAGRKARGPARKINHDDVEHRQPEYDEDRGDSKVEPRRRIDRAE